ncbi:M28 family peptidase [Tsuneonella sp. YG55]|uniref:M28 family peptidase n=1 Tax=Tsuneonella litorea TaxID=2976475 RepID=A0A9X2W2P4_9SPHN|nr:M28 family peptidase [Tsuneonella litorea]MCT2558880.1 M28 family peptidase [Tsuneonella litorea]
MRNLAKAPVACAALLLLAGNAAPGPVDPDSRAWWALATELSSDSMEGRDAGSGGYERAARLVAERMAAAGLQPLGEDGTWFQRVSLQERAVTDATLNGPGGNLAFLDEFTVDPQPGLPSSIELPIAYRGYCGAGVLGDVRGKLVICHGTRRDGLPNGKERDAALRNAGAAGLAEIADPGFEIEPPRWPYAYARRVIRSAEAENSEAFIDLTINADALDKLIGSGRAAALVADGATGRDLPSFDGGVARMTFAMRTAQYSSPNVIGYLPGTDPALADQAIVLGAHLDGYGFGRAVDGDAIYNGTLDDAAYVALIVHLMELRKREGYRRPIVVGIWTGEEKGLHGSRWFVDHPTIPLSRVAANINLDQLRPIFPLELLTIHARDDTTLGRDASSIAEAMGIVPQDDPEPERNLIRRTDHWPFIQAGIPAVNFVFGFAPGSASEAVYREWYRTGYHKPQDDVNQPIDWQAAADFNRFFYALVDRVANADAAPAWLPDSELAPRKSVAAGSVD